MRTLFSLVILSSVSVFAPAQTQPQLNLMPMPASVDQGSGQLAITRSFTTAVTGSHDASLDRAVKEFETQLARQTGMFLWSEAKPATATLTIHADHARKDVQELGEDESYTLTVTDSGAKLDAPNPLGVVRGLQTFRQLIQPTASGFAIPAVTIKDQPRFPWRGTLIDVSRHFIPLDVLKRNLDAMAAVKLNVLHWHLSDDQGFRAESKVFPKLTGMGSEGQFYSQSEIREFIAYAHDRGIRVVPEFDMPGHSRSWFIGYPELASNPGPFSFGPATLESVIDPTQEATYKFLDKFVGEMAALFPDAYFHIGGDEVNGKYWDANPKIQAFKQAHGMKDNKDLQVYFNQRLEKIVTKHHKIVVGWDEVLHPGLPKNVVVQSWRGQESLAEAAKQGYRGMLSFGYYLDLMWPAARHYAVEPMSGNAASLTPEQQKSILGGESCMWAEWVSPENVDSHIWPRNAVVAERLWSPQSTTDVDSMYARMNAVSLQLESMGLTHRSARMKMLHRMAGTGDITALRTLADVVEPVKDYHRWDDSKGPIDFHMPLNRMIDAVYPESDVARNFGNAVHKFVASKYQDRAAEGEIRSWLTLWRDNDAKLQPLLVESFLLREDAQLSSDLSHMAAAGLQALDSIDKGQAIPEELKTQQAARAASAKTVKDGLLLMAVDPVSELISGSAPAKQTD